MESRWMSGCVKSIAHTIPAHYLSSSANIFSDEFIHRLGQDLESNRQQLASELGFSMSFSTSDGLYNWCNNPGSTVFVLVSVLANLCRTDCIHKIEQYIQYQVMQLFVKVEQAVTDGQSVAVMPQFHQIITCCQFSLLKALEYVFGSDLVYYEIVGPGSWVMWTTQAKELKGQQLTLVYHSQPVSATREALCDDPMEQGTEVKQALCDDPMEQETEVKRGAMVTQNIPASSADLPEEETHVKVLECTQIESLKYSQGPSIQTSNSNNLTLSDSLNKANRSPRSLSVEGPTKSHSPITVDSKLYQFSLDGKTHVKTLLVDRQNKPEYAHVVKHFPDKLLYEVSPSGKDGECSQAGQVHPQQVLDNVPRLSLLEDNFSSLLPSAQRPFAQPQQEEKQSNLNDLSCMVFSASTRPSMNMQTLPKLSALEQVISHSVSRATDNVTLSRPAENFTLARPSNIVILANPVDSVTLAQPVDNVTLVRSTDNVTLTESSRNISTGVDFVAQIPELSEANLSKFGTSSAARSLLAADRDTRFSDVPVTCFGGDYLPHTCMKTLRGCSENYGSTSNHVIPRSCDSCHLKTNSLHINNELVQPVLISEQNQPEGHHRHHCHGLQHQSLLDVHEMKSKPLWLQDIQRQQALALPQVPLSFQDLDSSMESHNQSIWPQKIFHQDSEIFQEPQLPRTYPNHTSSQEYHQTGRDKELNYQGFHLFDRALQEDIGQQAGELCSQQEVQSSAGAFLKADASPYLMCHTPPPGFPDEQLPNIHPSVPENTNSCLHSQSVHSSHSTDEFGKSSQLADKPSQMTKTDTGKEQYMKMFHPSTQGADNSKLMSSFVRSQSSLGHKVTPLQNVEFTNNILTAPNTSQKALTHMKSVISSDSSGGSSDYPVFIYSQPFTVFTEGQSSLMTPKPFHPAPLPFDILGRHMAESMPNDHHLFRATVGGISSLSQEDDCWASTRGQFTRSKSLPVNHFKGTKWPAAQEQKMDIETSFQNIEAQLVTLEGWCPQVNGDTIQDIMEKFRSQDGNYIIWKSRRLQKFVISVSYLNQLFHFRVEEVTSQKGDKTEYFLFEGGYSTTSFLDLVRHYRQNGIRILMQSAAGRKKTYIENIHLLCPLKVKPQLIRSGTSKSK